MAARAERVATTEKGAAPKNDPLPDLHYPNDLGNPPVALPLQAISGRSYEPLGLPTSKIIVGFLVVSTCVILYLIFFNKTSEEIQVVGQSQPVVPAVITEDTTTTPAEPVSTIGDSMVLTLTAKEEVWVSVTLDEKPGFRGTLEAGMSKTFTAAN